MKRIILAAAVAASLGAAAPAQAQLDDIAIADPNFSCLTPVTKCVDELADRGVAAVMYYYDLAGDVIRNGPDLGAVCELIWENGCGTDGLPL